MITFSDVTVAFKSGKTALQNVSLKINKNEFVFLVGASGAGKSTVLNSIMGIHKPTSGSLEVGEPPLKVSSLRGNKMAKHRQSIGFIFQDFKILPYKNIFENILLALKAKNIPATTHKREVMDSLVKVGLQDKYLEFPIQLSAGELQRIAIARAFAGDRSIILADEPTGNLDPKTTWDVMKIFTSLIGQKTILIATHNTDIVNSMKKRTITIDSGKILSDQ
jgi:cell division transport system ATP-binding protein